MDGNKSGCLEERWRLLRHLHEGHGIELDTLSLLAEIELTRLMERSISEGWDAGTICNVSSGMGRGGQGATYIPLQDTAGEVEMARHTRQAKLKAALKLATYLGGLFDSESRKGFEEQAYKNSDAQIKEMLSIAKALQFLEGMTTNLEKSADEALQYPQDTLEFHQQLEKQIANLAAAAAGGADRQNESV